MSDWRALLVHGAGGGAWEWTLWNGVLEAHAIPVHAIDLQPSTHGLPATGFGDYARQVSEALELLPRPRLVVGASLGGLLAAACADQADALVLVNPLPPAPWHEALPLRHWEDVIPWRSQARFASTRAAMSEADDASRLHAFRLWRDESGLAMRQAVSGRNICQPACPVLFMASANDADVPAALTRQWADAWGCDVVETIACSHLGPLLGRDAVHAAGQAVAWLNRQVLHR